MKKKIVNYFNETLAEMKKVAWPDRQYVGAATMIILVIVLMTGFFVLFIDYALGSLFKLILG
ncbi:preprotein translocase subunit SecE [candidate division WOR-1 bacterium RIFOXYA12_FULL_52_29]|uniref:Protein translocase subunit SecE n=1 Tax=candidate division WOR-1 bacterium RIFOXYC12_FULL_54_18 TaxID=1802584 RepID=A0A1F4T5N9_UNCSA|nr:MAG: preprotein translocase subunit SecE [candidate division WOR-1 bacterium RIFOXYA2_FULL_51_19]OGC17601.1 MAG: preprotein translocase subunit SecE [candidate division WOR-1 bacterium RIFOXYA12_FULL_52_29]OGC26458.1 MAG: preprotein translocase subunit SecE [candidate division WOR-1 bacterium RIFOXYB2_FULL_45_9]OGC28018.1 MAG: preprotein translocase subunit SecE [candidate division WOR-1 bacterium RIFOXYC12_FULL_54_18]OGC29696.1 MAG: preprotein translocase subunit SecE [candidate division WO